MLHDEVYRIGREVMRNAFLHAGAKKVETEIRYDKNELRLRVRDDGRGLDPKVLDSPDVLDTGGWQESASAHSKLSAINDLERRRSRNRD